MSRSVEMIKHEIRVLQAELDVREAELARQRALVVLDQLKQRIMRLCPEGATAVSVRLESLRSFANTQQVSE